MVHRVPACQTPQNIIVYTGEPSKIPAAISFRPKAFGSSPHDELKVFGLGPMIAYCFVTSYPDPISRLYRSSVRLAHVRTLS